MQVILGVAWILVVWCVASLCLVGLGGLLLREGASRRLSTSFWLGLVGCVAILQLSQFVLPVAPWGTMLVCLPGVFGLLRGRHRVLRWLAGAWRSRKAELLLIAMIAVVAAYRATGAPRLFDTGLYQYQIGVSS